MRTGVVEIMKTGHVTFAETLCRIFCSDPSNQVYLFTIEKHSGNFGFLCDLFPNLDIVIKDQGKNLSEFLNETEAYNLDRIYLVTLSSQFRIISGWRPKARLHLTIHNIDEWFGNSFPRSVKKFVYFSKRTPLKLWVYFFKVCFIHPPLKRKILKNVTTSGGVLVVLSGSLQERLTSLKIGIPSEVIPFSVFVKNLSGKENSGSEALRICVPGVLSQYRRDYIALFDLIANRLKEFKELFTLDLLGGTPADIELNNPEFLFRRIHDLQENGFAVIDHKVKFIPQAQYDIELGKADIILGNMNVTLNKYSIYGITKETGIPFAMIRAAKPGIMPADYPLQEELAESTIVYSSFENLGEILIDLLSNRSKIKDLKMKALQNSLKFTPELVYERISANIPQ